MPPPPPKIPPGKGLKQVEPPQAAPPPQDQYREFAQDPRLLPGYHLNTLQDSPSDLLSTLGTLVNDIGDKQILYDELRNFKRQQVKVIQRWEDAPLKNRDLILSRLSELAVAILTVTFNHVGKVLEAKFGSPQYLSAYPQWQAAELALISMGKLAAREINYESDLDLIFVYSHIGETHGRKVLTNGEYFAKLVQRLINMLSLNTIAGRCYEIDTDLRPSGHCGTLVTSYDHFIDHQMNRSQHWERQALLRARVEIAGQEFRALLAPQIDEMAYDRPVPGDFFFEMNAIRERVLKEKAREDAQRVDLKYGLGALMDIDFLLHRLQLRFARIFPALRTWSTAALFTAAHSHRLLPEGDLLVLQSTHTLLRTLESHLQLMKQRSEHVLELDGEVFGTIRERLGFVSDGALREALLAGKQAVRRVYLDLYLRMS